MDGEKRRNKKEDKAAKVSNSVALARGHSAGSVRETIPPILEGEVVSAPTTIGANIALGEDVGASSHLTDDLDK